MQTRGNENKVSRCRQLHLPLFLQSYVSPSRKYNQSTRTRRLSNGAKNNRSIRRGLGRSRKPWRSLLTGARNAQSDYMELAWGLCFALFCDKYSCAHDIYGMNNDPFEASVNLSAPVRVYSNFFACSGRLSTTKFCLQRQTGR